MAGLIMKKTREMIAYGHDCLYNKQFPRNQRIGNAIGAQIEKSMYEILEGLSDVAKKEHKKKLMYFVMIGTAFLIGWGIREMGGSIGINLDFAMLIGWYVTAVMLINEFTSILENLYVIMPEKVPVWLIKTLKVADKQLGDKINDLVCKNQNCDTCELSARCNLKKYTPNKEEK